MSIINTKQKIKIATVIYRIIRIYRKFLRKSNRVVVRRQGVLWDLDLQEGIDLSIYVLGGFEIKTISLYRSILKEGFIALDIGANIGAHVLPMATLVGDTGMVYAFEPTQYAYKKLVRNVDLNPKLQKRIYLGNIMLSNNSQVPLSDGIYSSWPLIVEDNLHSEHRGRLMSCAGASVQTLDEFILDKRLSKVDFIKIDVDGNEIDVLKGASSTVKKFKPIILMEFAPYLFENNISELEVSVMSILNLSYFVRDASSGKVLPNSFSQICSMVPYGGSMNILFMPS